MKEAQLWKRLTATKAATMHRIETGGTILGVADVEYVSFACHGWIELKTSCSKLNAPIVLQHPLSWEQAAWVHSHHRPEISLRSYVLVGFIRRRRWECFLYVPGEHCFALMPNRGYTAQQLARRPGVYLGTELSYPFKRQ